MSSIAIAGSGGGGGSGRTLLTGNLNYYVATTGSDSNNGLTPATAFATIQHAMNVISSTLDLGGFFVVVNIGVGTFVGLGLKSSIGGGNILFIGAGRTSTFIGNGPNDGVYNFGECITAAVSVGATTIGVDALTFQPTTDNTHIYLGVFTLFCLGNNLTFPAPDIGFDCTHMTSHNVIFAQAPVLIFDEGGTMTVTGGNGTVISLVNLQFAAVYEHSARWVIGGNLTVSDATAIVAGASQFLPITGAGNFLGAGVTGKRFMVGTGSVIGDADGTVGALGPTFFAGTTAGTTDSSSSYDGISGSNQNYQQPITGFSITLNNADTQVILDPAGALLAGTITMQPNPLDGQVVTIRTSQSITTLTINGNVGQTIAGYSAGTLALGGVLNAIYKASNTTWYF